MQDKLGLSYWRVGTAIITIFVFIGSVLAISFNVGSKVSKIEIKTQSNAEKINEISRRFDCLEESINKGFLNVNKELYNLNKEVSNLSGTIYNRRYNNVKQN